MNSHWTRITNDVMDGVGLMEDLIISIKPLFFVVASITIKVQMSAKRTKYYPSTDLLVSLLSNKHFKPLYLVVPQRGGKLAGVGFYLIFFLFFMTDLTNFPNFLSFRFFSKYDIS